MFNTKAFKAYDLRGIYPTEVNEELAYRVGHVFAKMFKAKTVVVGNDIRLTGRKLFQALSDGLRDAGVAVIDIGQCGTEMIYFATAHLHADGGIMITASHNPADYNGMKLVTQGARPVSADTGLKDIERQVAVTSFTHGLATGVKRGTLTTQNIMPAYIEHLLTYIDTAKLRPLKIVVNPGNGGAGAVLNELAKHLPFTFVKVNFEPDGHFPNGVPNPLLPNNREATASKVRAEKADLGIAWDGDFDRCFFFDEKAEFIEGYYIVGLLAASFLQKEAHSKIMYDPRLVWNTEAIIDQYQGTPVRCKSGHAFMKECMREQGIVYGGEMSSHHYFRSFTNCDSGMIPWLLVTELISTTGKTLHEMVAVREAMYPCSGEINRKVADAKAVLAAVEGKYHDGTVDKLDGLSVAYAKWRFNLRVSNTEPVIRLNVETKGDKVLLAQKTKELLTIIGGEEA
jgi:phosphomannomutase